MGFVKCTRADFLRLFNIFLGMGIYYFIHLFVYDYFLFEFCLDALVKDS